MEPETIAAYLSRSLTATERAEVEEHLVACSDCRHDLAEGAEHGWRTRRQRTLRVAGSVGAAAVLVLIVGSLQPSPPEPVLRDQTGESAVSFSALGPEDGAAVVADSLVFRWVGQGSDVHYRLTVTDANGDVLWTAGTSDTTITAPATVGLRAGRRYFWFVDALLEGARSATSGVREFVVRPP